MHSVRVPMTITITRRLYSGGEGVTRTTEKGRQNIEGKFLQFWVGGGHLGLRRHWDVIRLQYQNTIHTYAYCNVQYQSQSEQNNSICNHGPRQHRKSLHRLGRGNNHRLWVRQVNTVDRGGLQTPKRKPRHREER